MIVLYIVAMGALTPSSVGALYIISVYHNMYDAKLLLIIFYQIYL